jgi:hypothetical protein
MVTGTVVQSVQTIEAFEGQYDKATASLSLPIHGSSLEHINIDTSWLRAASSSYNVSADPRDYVLTDVPIVTVDIPNRNAQAFPYEEVSYFDPLYGRMVYQTFIGKPAHQDHDNRDPLKAKGVIFDAALQYVQPWDIWKIRLLCGWDRTKDTALVNSILSGDRSSYSMGALCEAFICSRCGANDTNIQPCGCMKTFGKGGVDERGQLIYQMCSGVNYIENSSVEDPADITADTAHASQPIWA